MKKGSLLAVLTAGLMLCGCSKTQSDNTKVEQPLIIMAGGNLYYWTEETDCLGSADDIDGYIISTVDKDKTPAKDGETNFGCIGNPYAYGNENGDWLLVKTEDNYHIFKKQE